MKDGFRFGYRPIIFLDGCFLKGYYGGQLLTAVGIDANDCMYHLAYAAVESENFESWYWFLMLLMEDFYINDSYYWTFMSDKQKGLIEAIRQLMPNAEHRNCVRHLYTNFRSVHKGKALKDCLWKAAKATYLKQYEDAMKEMKALSVEAHAWLQEKDPSQWCKAHFRTNSKCDLVLNNLCESFNNYILEARDKPILTLMETIRTKLMQRVTNKNIAAQKYGGPLCPNVQKKLDKIVTESTKCWSRHSGGTSYQVPYGPSNQHVVDLRLRSCSCRKWDLSGIPCIHVVSAMLLEGERPETYVDVCYSKETQMKIYSNFISPIKGANQWKFVENMKPILPPELRRPPGRPHKNRRKGADEKDEATKFKIGKKGYNKTYKKCGKPGHNIRTCKREVGANKPIKRRVPKLPVRKGKGSISRGKTVTASESSSSVVATPATILRWMPDGSSQVVQTQ